MKREYFQMIFSLITYFEYGRNNLCIVPGMAQEGEGLIYDLAKQYNLSTLGIIFEYTKKNDSISKSCDIVLSELQESLKLNINVKIHRDFLSSPEKVSKHLEKKSYSRNGGSKLRLWRR